jgi:hypothetical protein
LSTFPEVFPCYIDVWFLTKENKVANALSRRIHGVFELNISREASDLEQRIRVAGNNDENYTKTVADVWNNIENSDRKI